MEELGKGQRSRNFVKTQWTMGKSECEGVGLRLQRLDIFFCTYQFGRVLRLCEFDS